MDGFVILNEYSAFNIGKAGLIVLAFLFLIFLGIWVFFMFQDKCYSAGFTYLICTLFLLGLTIIGVYSLIKDTKTTIYDIYIEEGNEISNFLEQYEIIEDHGTYFSVIEREDE